MLAFGVVSTPKGKTTMSYAILRTKKLKEWGNICASLEHNFRERLTPNADADRTPENVFIGGQSSEQVRAEIEKALPQKYRADCVKCIEYLITASPEWFEGRSQEVHRAYFDKAIEWLKERHGAENIKCLTIHNDESTPHLVAYVVPIDERGKLNAKKWLGGKKLLSDMQSDFAERVKKFGLSRGVENSKATHQRVQRFYGDLNAPTPKISLDDITQKVVKKGLGLFKELEPIENVANRVNEHIRKALEYKKAEIHKLKREIQSLKADVEMTEKRGNVKNYETVKENIALNAEIRAIQSEFQDYKGSHRINTKNLSMSEIERLNGIADEIRKERLAKGQKRSGGIKI